MISLSVNMMTYSSALGKVKTAYGKFVTIFADDRLRVWYVFSFFILLFLVSYMSIEKAASLDDHFFHIRFASTILEKGWGALSDFRSIYFSRMGIGHEYLVYYNFLFYLALLPFALLKPLILGIKLYGVLALAVSFTAVYAFLRNVCVRYPFLWTLGFAAALMESGWLLRFSLARPFTLAPVFLIAMLYAVHRKKYGLSAVLPFLFFFWHTATFMFPLCLAFGYFVMEQFYGRKPDWKKVLMPLLGTAAAVLVAYAMSPGVISYLRDVIFPVFFDTALTKRVGIAEGNEVYGKDFFILLRSMYGFVAALLVFGSYEILLYVREKRGIRAEEERIDPDMEPLRLTLFMAALVFFAASTLSARFVDYFVYFCLLYIAIAATDAFRFVSIRGTFRSAVRAGLLIVSLYFFVSVVFDFSTTIAEVRSHLTVEAPAEWLNENVQKDAIIFNTSWSSFPTLYYFTGDRFRYVTGLEPRFLYDLDPRLYFEWRNIGDNGVYCDKEDCEDVAKAQGAVFRSGEAAKKEWYRVQGDRIADAIRSDFDSDIVVVSIGQQELLDVMDGSDRFRKELFDKQNSAYGVYRIVGKVE